MNKPNLLTKRHVFCFNEHDNGSESILLVTESAANAGAELITQELSLQSYGNSASIHTGYVFTPALLRKLADELEFAIDK
jgi:hypothetical protein